LKVVCGRNVAVREKNGVICLRRESGPPLIVAEAVRREGNEGIRSVSGQPPYLFFLVWTEGKVART